MQVKYMIRIALVALLIAGPFAGIVKLLGFSNEAVAYSSLYIGVAAYFTILHKIVVPTRKP